MTLKVSTDAELAYDEIRSRIFDGRLAPGMEVIGKPFPLEALAARVQAMLEMALVR